MKKLLHFVQTYNILVVGQMATEPTNERQFFDTLLNKAKQQMMVKLGTYMREVLVCSEMNDKFMQPPIKWSHTFNNLHLGLNWIWITSSSLFTWIYFLYPFLTSTFLTSPRSLTWIPFLPCSLTWISFLTLPCSIFFVDGNNASLSFAYCKTHPKFHIYCASHQLVRILDNRFFISSPPKYLY